MILVVLGKIDLFHHHISLNVLFLKNSIVSKKFRINPDNVATPVAASLGDLTTLAILSNTADAIHGLEGTLQITPG